MKIREIFAYRLMAWLYFTGMLVLQSKKSQKWFSFGFWSIGYTNDLDKSVEILKTNLITEEMLNDLKLYDYEDCKFKSYADYDKYLLDFYGKDYMIPKKKSHVDDYSKVIIN